MKIYVLSALAVFGLSLAGCGGGDSGSTAPPATPPNPGAGITPGAPTGVATGPGDLTALDQLTKGIKGAKITVATAGWPVAQDQDPENKGLKLLASTMGFRSRQDPFALLTAEKAFENSQRREKLFGETPTFGTYFVTPPEVTPEEEIVEAPPAGWRLAGIVQGNGVSAIMTNGTFPALDIKPGSVIPGTEWVVASIDGEKAILKRRSKKRPREWVVRLEGSLDGGNNNNSGGGDGGGPSRPGGPGGPGAPGGDGGVGRDI